MKYEFKSTIGMGLYHGLEPYQKVVNNGFVIETQDNNLIVQLIEDERRRNSRPIDWWLFKAGKTVLIDNYGDCFACTMNNNGQWIQLVKIVE